jgi:hypothetical protein
VKPKIPSQRSAPPVAPVSRVAIVRSASGSIALGGAVAERSRTEIVGPSARVSVRVHGAQPELREAIRAGWVRCVALLPTSPRGLPANWAVPLCVDEAVVAITPVVVEAVHAMGVAALVVKQHALSPVQTDEVDRERIASALADAMFAELPRYPGDGTGASRSE